MKALLILAVTLVPCTAAAGQVNDENLYVGAFSGGHVVLDDWDLHHWGNFGKAPSSGALAGLRLGAQIDSIMAVEASLGVLPYRGWTGQMNTAFNYSGAVLLFPFEGSWVPYGDIGFGAYHNALGDNARDLDANFHYGVGLKGMISERFALRADVRHIITDGYAGGHGLAQNLEISVAVDFIALLTGEPVDLAPVTADTDGDGIVDTLDSCHQEVGPRNTAGCPDDDQDGVADRWDRCPGVRGTVETSGCADRDLDGVADHEDRCPMLLGERALEGCPDSDQDGVADHEDPCPAAAGEAGESCPPQWQASLIP